MGWLNIDEDREIACHSVDEEEFSVRKLGLLIQFLWLCRADVSPLPYTTASVSAVNQFQWLVYTQRCQTKWFSILGLALFLLFVFVLNFVVCCGFPNSALLIDNRH